MNIYPPAMTEKSGVRKQIEAAINNLNTTTETMAYLDNIHDYRVASNPINMTKLFLEHDQAIESLRVGLEAALEQAEIGLANLGAYQSAPRGPTIHKYGQASRALILVRAALFNPRPQKSKVMVELINIRTPEGVEITHIPNAGDIYYATVCGLALDGNQDSGREYYPSTKITCINCYQAFQATKGYKASDFAKDIK